MAQYGRIRRDQSALSNGVIFGRRRRNLKLYFYVFWVFSMAAAGVVFWQLDQIRPRVASLFNAPPTATPTSNQYVTWAESAYANGDLSATIVNYRKATELDPRNVDYLYKLSRALIYRSYGDLRDLVSDVAEAKKWAEQAVTIAPNDARAHSILCFALIRNDLSGDAVRACLRALDLDAQSADAHAYLSMAYYDLRRTSAALEQAEQAVQLDPQSIDANLAYARALFFQGRPGAALRHYQQAAAINQNLEFPYFELAFFASTLANQNNGDEARYRIAIAAYNLVLNKNPKSVKAYTRLCQTYLQKGEPKLAREYCLKATDIDPGYIDAWRWLGEVYHKSRNYEDAVVALETCARLSDASNIPKDRRDPTCWWLRGVGWFVLGYCDRAIPILEDVLRWSQDEIAIRQTNITLAKCADDAAFRGTYKTPTPMPQPTVRPTPIL